MRYHKLGQLSWMGNGPRQSGAGGLAVGVGCVCVPAWEPRVTAAATAGHLPAANTPTRGRPAKDADAPVDSHSGARAGMGGRWRPLASDPVPRSACPPQVVLPEGATFESVDCKLDLEVSFDKKWVPVFSTLLHGMWLCMGVAIHGYPHTCYPQATGLQELVLAWRPSAVTCGWLGAAGPWNARCGSACKAPRAFCMVQSDCTAARRSLACGSACVLLFESNTTWPWGFVSGFWANSVGMPHKKASASLPSSAHRMSWAAG
jgi:hypothetical protein